jgi:hypothetical protein
MRLRLVLVEPPFQRAAREPHLPRLIEFNDAAVIPQLPKTIDLTTRDPQDVGDLLLRQHERDRVGDLHATAASTTPAT